MIYFGTVLLAAGVVFFAHRSRRVAEWIGPLRNLAFFKVHYLLAGAIFSVALPDGFAPVFQGMAGPVIIFCLAWVGIYFGCGLEYRFHQRFSGGTLLNNIIQPVILFLVFIFAGGAYLQLQGETAAGLAQFHLVALCCAFSLYRRYGVHFRTGPYPTIPALEDLLPIGHVIPVVLLAVAAYFRGGEQEFRLAGLAFTGPAPYFLIQTGAAVAAGMVLNMLIAGTATTKGMTVVLAGGTAMLGGLSFSYTFSPLFMGTIAGAFLINATLKRLPMLDALNDGQEVVERVFMFFLGAWISPLFLPGEARIALAAGAAVLLFLIRALLNYVLAGAWIARAPFRMRSKSLLWIGLTGQGTLAAAAVMESSLRISNHPTTIAGLVILLVLNQLAFGAYVLATDRPDRWRRR